MCIIIFFSPFLSFSIEGRAEYTGDFHLDLFAHMLYQSLTFDVLCFSLIPCSKRLKNSNT